jgi:deazaflavin-dependent oxidoreductase (nitroreductase family)
VREGYWVTAGADLGQVLHRVSNPLVTAVLRSRFHKLLSGSAAVLTVTGRRSGRRYHVPVQYAADGQTVYVVPGGWEHKTWWRNLIPPAKVRLRLQGRDVTGVGQALSGDHDPQLVAAGMTIYLSKFATSARVRGIGRDARGRPDPGQLQRAVPHEVIVRLILDPPEQAT